MRHASRLATLLIGMIPFLPSFLRVAEAKEVVPARSGALTHNVMSTPTTLGGATLREEALRQLLQGDTDISEEFLRVAQGVYPGK